MLELRALLYISLGASKWDAGNSRQRLAKGETSYQSQQLSRCLPVGPGRERKIIIRLHVVPSFENQVHCL